MDDVAAIKELTARYNRGGDERDFAGWVGCFTADGVFARADNGESWQGEEALHKMYDAYPVRGRHVTTDFIIEISDDGKSAHQTCYLMFFERAKGFALHMFGVYEDDLVQQDGRWLFQRRVLHAEVVGA